MNHKISPESPLLFGGVAGHAATLPEYNRYIQTPEAFFRWLTTEYIHRTDAAMDLSELSTVNFDWLWKLYLAFWEAQRADSEFLRWIATIWVYQNEVPTEATLLKNFTFEPLEQEYTSFLDAGRKVPERALSLEELWLLNHLVLRTPLYCLLNVAQPDQPLERVTHYRKLTSEEIWGELQVWYANPALDHPLPDRPAGIAPTILLVYDGAMMAHVVTAYTIWKNRLHFQDPWPGRSLLCKENNAAGIRARKSNLMSGGWSINEKEFQQVVFAAMLYEYPPEIARQGIMLSEQERQEAERESTMMEILRQLNPPDATPILDSIPGAVPLKELEFAASTGQMWRVKVALINGADVNEQGAFGTALHIAAAKGYMDIVRLLLDQGADVLIRDSAGKIPSDVAAENRHTKIAKYLRSFENR